VAQALAAASRTLVRSYTIRISNFPTVQVVALQTPAVARVAARQLCIQMKQAQLLQL
jgi:hypothetical protein